MATGLDAEEVLTADGDAVSTAKRAIFQHAVDVLGMDPVKDKELIWIAEEALLAELPEPWTRHYDDSENVSVSSLFIFYSLFEATLE